MIKKLTISEIKKSIRIVSDFPKKGINFYDIASLLKNPEAFHSTIECIVDYVKSRKDVTGLVAIEARGFIFATPVAYICNLPVVMVRRSGKLPGQTIEQKYETEYGFGVKAIQMDVLSKSDNIIIIDDLIAFGGTVAATIKLVEQLKARVDSVYCITNLFFLQKRPILNDYHIESLIKHGQP